MKFSVFSAMMRKDHSPEQTVVLAQEAGLDGIEWGLAEGYNFDLPEALRRPDFLPAITRGARLEIVAYSPGLRLSEISKHEAEVRGLFRLAEQTSVPMVRFWSSSYGHSHEARLRQSYLKLLDADRKALARLIRDFKPGGVKVILEMHFGCITSSASNSWRLLRDFDPKDVGMIYDPGNCVVEGMEAWKLGIEALGPYLAHVHVKNLVWKYDAARREETPGRNGWRWDWAALDEGLADWREIVACLKATGYDGYLSLEDFSPRPLAVRLAEARQLRAWAELY